MDFFFFLLEIHRKIFDMRKVYDSRDKPLKMHDFFSFPFHNKNKVQFDGFRRRILKIIIKDSIACLKQRKKMLIS